jgi:surfeit locus 1 family protein
MIRFKPLLVPTLWFLPGLLLLLGLGVWQVDRLHWKEALIASVETGMKAPPAPLKEVLAQNGLNEAEWHHVSVMGHFLHDKEVYLFAPGPMGQPGVQVVTPFLEDSGETILVNRGFVPDSLRKPETRPQGEVEGETTLTGVLRLSQQPGLFTPAANLNTRLWFVKNVPDMAAAIGIATPPYIVEADGAPNPGGWPLGGQTIVDFPNNHLQYAITWFGLALALTGVYLVYHVNQGRLRIG